MHRVADIRWNFIELKASHPNGNAPGSMYELIGMSFIADAPTIFGEPDESYIARELAWYHSQSLNVHDIPGGPPPKIWLDVADVDRNVNSNYGFLIWSKENGRQYDEVLKELLHNPSSRRGAMIYTRPTMHHDAFVNGRSDFVCTNAVNYFIRDGQLNAVVQMRSNDVVFGYRNDYAWQRYVLQMLANDLNVPAGDIIWNAASLHVYPRHHHLIPDKNGASS